MSVTGSVFKKTIFDGETKAFWITESENQEGRLSHKIKEA